MKYVREALTRRIGKGYVEERCGRTRYNMKVMELLEDFNQIADTDYEDWKDVPREALLRVVISLLITARVREAQ